MNTTAGPNASAADATPSCDGSGPSIPEGYPQLGPGCLSHFVFTELKPSVSPDVNDVSAARGVRSMPAPHEGFDLGVRSVLAGEATHPIWIFLPSLEPGYYWLYDGASVVSQDLFSPYHNSHGSLVVVEGASDGAIWGRFMGEACVYGLDFSSSYSNPTVNDCVLFVRGRFAAALEDLESVLENGWHTPPPTTDHLGGTPVPAEMPCETKADCKHAISGYCPTDGCTRCESIGYGGGRCR